MLRRFSTVPGVGSSMPLPEAVSRRTAMNGFSLYTREKQKESNVIKSKSLAEGSRTNMKVMSQLWKGLTLREQRKWNKRAYLRRSMRATDVYKRNSAFNLVMRVFAQGDGALLNAGNEKFTAMIAKRTAGALNARQTTRLHTKFNIGTAEVAPKPAKALSKNDAKRRDTFHRMSAPDMSLFTSFTEMQHSVAPTQEIAFVYVSKALAGYHVSAGGDRSLHKKFKELTPDEQDRFSPVSAEESPAFEAFCANKCTMLDPARLDILSLFAQFRGMTKAREVPSSTVVALYRSLASMDRARDSLYDKTHRILLRMWEGRSSDCSLYISRTSPATIPVPPSAYAVDSGCLTDVDVANMLTDTRMNQSVYDDVLQRANILRPPARQKALQFYNVRSALAASMPLHLSPRRATGSGSVTFPVSRKAAAIKFIARAPKVSRKAAKQGAAKRAARSRKVSTAAPRLKARVKPTPALNAKTGAKAKTSAGALTVAHPATKAHKKVTKTVARKPAHAAAKSAAATKTSKAVRLSAARKTAKGQRPKLAARSAVTKRGKVKAVAAVAATARKTRTPAKPPARELEDDHGASSAVEDAMLADGDDLADYDDFEHDSETETGGAARKLVAAKAGAERKKKKTSKAKRRIRNIASLIKGVREPLVLTSHIAPIKKAKTTPSAPPASSGYRSANQPRRQLSASM